MPSARASIAVALLSLGALPAAAQQPTARQEYEAIVGRPKRAPAVPRELREMVAETTPDRLVVRGLDGQHIPVSLDWIEPDAFAAYQDGRFLGFSFIGYEAEGYFLVDRRSAGQAAVIATGHAPLFSPDGRYFAAAELTDSGFGNLNGVALWEVLADRTVRRFFTDVLPRTVDWRVDGWVRRDCVAISAVQPGHVIEDTQNYAEAVRHAPRFGYGLEVGEGIHFEPTYDRGACRPPETP